MPTKCTLVACMHMHACTCMHSHTHNQLAARTHASTRVWGCRHLGGPGICGQSEHGSGQLGARSASQQSWSAVPQPASVSTHNSIAYHQHSLALTNSTSSYIRANICPHITSHSHSRGHSPPISHREWGPPPHKGHKTRWASGSNPSGSSPMHMSHIDGRHIDGGDAPH